MSLTMHVSIRRRSSMCWRCCFVEVEVDGARIDECLEIADVAPAKCGSDSEAGFVRVSDARPTRMTEEDIDAQC